MEYIGLHEISGSIAILEGVTTASYDEIVRIEAPNTTPRMGRVLKIEGERAVVLVFEGTAGLSLSSAVTKFTGRHMEITLSPEIIGRKFDGMGNPIDGMGSIRGKIRRNINGKPVNPVNRSYPRSYMHTGISAIDCLATLIRGQKLPIFSADGLPHDILATQISPSGGQHCFHTVGVSVSVSQPDTDVRQVRSHTVEAATAPSPDGERPRLHTAGTTVADSQLAKNGEQLHSHAVEDFTSGANRSGRKMRPDLPEHSAPEKFATVFAAMGVSHDTARYFQDSFDESERDYIMFQNLASDPTAQRIATPRLALTAAEYLAYDLGYHVLVILTDITSYAEALREISSQQGEIPSRKGYPGYMYSDLASLYERAGIIKNKPGSVTQIPILTMPSEDITHPIPDLTGYITEGQIVLDRSLHQKNIYPPINVLPSLSRLMKDGIGEGYTTKEHPAIAAKLFAAYVKVEDIRALAAIIGEDDLSPEDKMLLNFGKQFEAKFLSQSPHESRSLAQTMSIAEELLQAI